MDWSFLIADKHSLSVTTDSRKVTPGCVFVALKGEHVDGNLFVEQARQAGAAYVIHGDDALVQLQDLARTWVTQWRNLPSSFGKTRPVIAITGTNGKTTTKELTATVLQTRYRVRYTQGNYNNALGVPLTLLSLTANDEIAVVEMGASHPGDIQELVEIAEPNYGLITNVGRAHLQGFGSFEGVMQTKGELYDYLIARQGSVFRNEDNLYLNQMWNHAVQKAKACGLSVQSQQYLYQRIPMPKGTHLVGDYNAENIAAALCIGEHFGVTHEQGMQAIRAYIPSNNRSQSMQTERNHLIVDAYNANPTSMQAAIQTFQADTYILGSMRELGDYEQLEHQNIVNMLLERKAGQVYLIGNEWKQTTAPYPIYDSAETFRQCLIDGKVQLNGCHILLKGSRSNRLEQLIDCL